MSPEQARALKVGDYVFTSGAQRNHFGTVAEVTTDYVVVEYTDGLVGTLCNDPRMVACTSRLHRVGGDPEAFEKAAYDIASAMLAERNRREP